MTSKKQLAFSCIFLRCSFLRFGGSAARPTKKKNFPNGRTCERQMAIPARISQSILGAPNQLLSPFVTSFSGALPTSSPEAAERWCSRQRKWKKESNEKRKLLYNYSGRPLEVCSTVLPSKRLLNKCVNCSKHAFNVWLILGNKRKGHLHKFAAGYIKKK